MSKLFGMSFFFFDSKRKIQRKKEVHESNKQPILVPWFIRTSSKNEGSKIQTIPEKSRRKIMSTTYVNKKAKNEVIIHSRSPLCRPLIQGCKMYCGMWIGAVTVALLESSDVVRYLISIKEPSLTTSWKSLLVMRGMIRISTCNLWKDGRPLHSLKIVELVFHEMLSVIPPKLHTKKKVWREIMWCRFFFLFFFGHYSFWSWNIFFLKWGGIKTIQL